MILAVNPKKVDLFSILLIVIAAVVAYIMFFHQGITRYFFLNAQEKILRESLESTPLVNKTLYNIQNEVQTIQAKMDELSQRLPKKEHVDEILKQVKTASSGAGVQLGLVEPMEVIEADMYKQLPIKISFQGSYKNCFCFFAKLENLPRVLQLENLAMRKKGDFDVLEIEMILSAFMLK